jgi:hypothetical protein
LNTLRLCRDSRSYSGETKAWRKRWLRDPQASAAVAVIERLVETNPIHGKALESIGNDQAAWTEQDLFPAPLLDGVTLKAEGFQPGPAFKTALEAVMDAQLEGRAHSQTDAIKVAREILERSKS